MENNKTTALFTSEVLKMERNAFIFKTIGIVLGYVIITYFLNAIRATAPIWLLWILIIIQFALYFSIFIASYQRFKVCGFNKYIGIFLFTLLAILGRINDWELAVIPLLVVVMIILSITNKNVSEQGKNLIPKQEAKN